MDEQLKQSALFAIMAMAITVTIFQLVFNSGMFGSDILFRKFFIGLGIGAVVGGAVFGVMHLLNKR